MVAVRVVKLVMVVMLVELVMLVVVVSLERAVSLVVGVKAGCQRCWEVWRNQLAEEVLCSQSGWGE